MDTTQKAQLPEEQSKAQRDQNLSSWFKIPIRKETLKLVAVIDNNLDLFDFSICTTMFSFIPNTQIKTVAKTKDAIKTREGVTMLPDYSFDDHFDDIEILAFAAGSGPSIELAKFIKKISSKVQFFFSICSGSLCLADAGILDSKKATVTKALFSKSLRQYPKVNWIRQARYVHDDNIITSSGGAAGLDAVFYLIKLIYGDQVAKNVAKMNEYNWVEDANIDPFCYIEDEFPLPKV